MPDTTKEIKVEPVEAIAPPENSPRPENIDNSVVDKDKIFA